MRFLKDLNVNSQRVLVRVDFNVPLDSSGNITDDKRIKEALPTIRYLLKHKAIVILISHLGRPNGEVVESLRLKPVADRLSQLLKKNILYLDDCIGEDLEEEINKAVPGEIFLLENLRFYKEEEDNDPTFAQSLADIADLYVNDAFGTCHRAHASVEKITKYLKSAAGFLIQKEIKTMQPVLNKPKKPFVVVLGGLKVSDKMGVLNNLLKKADKILIGGAMANTFIKAVGYPTGNSIIEKDKVILARKLIKKSRGKIIIPKDVEAAEKFAPRAKRKTVNIDSIPFGWEALDIGPKTIKTFRTEIRKAKTVFWNGTMGVAEWKEFETGTKEIAKQIAKVRGTTIAGGGDTAAAIDSFRLANKFTHISTGGGASLEFFEGKVLPGLKALEENAKKFK